MINSYEIFSDSFSVIIQDATMEGAISQFRDRFPQDKFTLEAITLADRIDLLEKISKQRLSDLGEQAHWEGQ